MRLFSICQTFFGEPRERPRKSSGVNRDVVSVVFRNGRGRFRVQQLLMRADIDHRAVQSMDVTQPLRRHLWNIHTNGQGAQDDPQTAGKYWEQIISRNSNNQKNGLAPIASLVGFMWTGASRLRLD